MLVTFKIRLNIILQDALKCCQNICYCANSTCSGQNPISQEYNYWQSTCPWERRPCEKYV